MGTNRVYLCVCVLDCVSILNKKWNELGAQIHSITLILLMTNFFTNRCILYYIIYTLAYIQAQFQSIFMHKHFNHHFTVLLLFHYSVYHMLFAKKIQSRAEK